MFQSQRLHQAIGVPHFRIWTYVDRAQAAADPKDVRRAFPDHILAEDLLICVGDESNNARTG